MYFDKNDYVLVWFKADCYVGKIIDISDDDNMIVTVKLKDGSIAHVNLDDIEYV